MLSQPHLLYAVFIVFFLANLLLLPLGWAAIKLFRRILDVPREVLMPLILIFCVVGSFAINNSVFGIGIMLALGVVGYLMEENGFPIAPAILGLVLGEMVEANFMTSMIKADGTCWASSSARWRRRWAPSRSGSGRGCSSAASGVCSGGGARAGEAAGAP
jgi:TctA family transporter